MRKAFAYLRVSGLGQAQGDGPERQTIAINQYAKANDIEVVRIFAEPGITGACYGATLENPITDLEQRPAFQDLLAALRTEPVKLVLIEKLDRLARSLMLQELILSDWRHKKIECISIAEPDFCTSDPTRTLMRQIMGAIAEYERAMIIMKLNGARNRKRSLGTIEEGRKPFGHAKFPKEQFTIQRILELSQQGNTLSRIASTLTSENLSSRSGKPWSLSTLSKIIKRSA